MKEKRRKIWIDRLQTRLLWQIAMYCALYYLVAWLSVVGWLQIRGTFDGVIGPADGISVISVLTLFLAVMAFLFILDAMKFAHRIVGPLYRFRKTIQAIKAGEEVELIRLRKYDFLTDMRDELNEMLKALEARGAIVLKKEIAGPSGASANCNPTKPAEIAAPQTAPATAESRGTSEKQ